MSPTYVQMTSLGSAVGLTSIPAGCTRVRMQAEAQIVRFRLDGTSPTTSVGETLAVGASITLEGIALADVKVIEVTSGAKLNLHYYTD